MISWLIAAWAALKSSSLITSALDLLAQLVKAIGIGGVIAIGIWVYEEGAPVLKDIPIINMVAEGHVVRANRQAAAEAVKDMVARSELTAATAALHEINRQRQAAQAAEDAANARAVQAGKDAADAKQKLEARIAADDGIDGCRVDGADVRWMSIH